MGSGCARRTGTRKVTSSGEGTSRPTGPLPSFLGLRAGLQHTGLAGRGRRNRPGDDTWEGEREPSVVRAFGQADLLYWPRDVDNPLGRRARSRGECRRLCGAFGQADLLYWPRDVDNHSDSVLARWAVSTGGPSSQGLPSPIDSRSMALVPRAGGETTRSSLLGWSGSGNSHPVTRSRPNGVLVQTVAYLGSDALPPYSCLRFG